MKHQQHADMKTNYSRNSGPHWTARSITAGLLLASLPIANATDNRAPEVPTRIQVADGNKVHFHAFAVGVQIYVSIQVSVDPPAYAWTLLAPDAVLFDDDGNVVGLHYGGPTWESNSGGKVIAARVDGVTVDPTAIPWLLLQKRSVEGSGVLTHTTFIQRVNTTGGLAPAAPTQAGLEARVPYTADYYFFRAE